MGRRPVREVPMSIPANRTWVDCTSCEGITFAFPDRCALCSGDGGWYVFDEPSEEDGSIWVDCPACTGGDPACKSCGGWAGWFEPGGAP